MKVKDEILEILDQCEVNENTLYLPNIQLDRKTYLDVNKVLEAIGGKWNRKAKGHVFDKDVSGLLEDIILTGEYVDAKKEFNFFPTPKEIAERLIALAEIKPNDLLLEPSAGQGAIADLFPKENKSILIELNNDNCEVLKSKGYEVLNKDFLETDYIGANKIIMNPPFTRQQDIEHIFHAYDILIEPGTLVSVCSTSPFFRDNKKAEKFRWFISTVNAEIFDLEPGAFKESGTMVATKIIKIIKNS